MRFRESEPEGRLNPVHESLESLKLKNQLLAGKVDRLITALRRANVALRKYEHCPHACQECFCVHTARAAVRDLELTGDIL